MTYQGAACYCDYELPEWSTTRKVKAARKRHKCDECRAFIEPGESYEYVSGKWGGLLDNFHICTLCKELREWAIISVPCFCWAYGNLHEDVREMVENTSPDVPGMFFEYGRRIVQIRRRKGKKLK